MERIRAITIALFLSSVCSPSIAAAPDSSSAGPQPSAATSILHMRGEVQAANDDWVRTGLRLQKGDVVTIIASGAVTLGEYSGKTGPGGDTSGIGKLEAKIGAGAAFGVGAQYAFIDSVPGVLKLRV